MLTIVVYGRNDSHGYNMHKRVAVSLNAFAQVLGREDDEIIFVDYATPWPLPTLPEAIGDTLTAKCRRHLRVIRVPAEVHAAVVGDRSHLFISEPLARNIGIRRAAATTQWILNTNTDMVFLPSDGGHLLPGIDLLEHDFYGIPRFELPEWLWERLDRLDPAGTIQLLRTAGPALCLDEATIGHPWIQFDAPGDFQLVRRSVLESVAGFDERMIWGWHVDSNLSRRLGLAGAELKSLRESVAGYHTNHDRVTTLLAREQRRGNDLRRFFYDCDVAVPDGQARTWGMPDVEFEEIRLDADHLSGLIERLAIDPGRRHGGTRDLRTLDDWARISYDVRHVVPFAVDFVVASAQTSLVGYAGVGDAMKKELATVVDRLGGRLCDIDEEATPNLDVAVIDLGLGGYPDDPDGESSERLGGLFSVIHEALALIERLHPDCRIVLINGQSGVWRSWVADRLIVAPGTLHSRVQLAKVNVDGAVPEAESQRVENVLRWFARQRNGINEGVSSEYGTSFFDTGDFEGFADGWDYHDGHGARMNGASATVTVRCPDLPPARWALQVAVRRIDDGDPEETGAMRVLVDIDGLRLGEVMLDARPHAVIATFEVPDGVSRDQASTVTFRCLRDDGRVYEPRYECDAFGRQVTWVRLELLAAYAVPPPEGDGARELRFGDLNEVLPTFVNGWEGAGGGLIVGPRAGVIRLPSPVAGDGHIGLELSRVGTGDPYAAELAIEVDGHPSVVSLPADRMHHRIVVPVQRPVVAGTDVSVGVSPWTRGEDDGRGSDWRVSAFSVLERPRECLPASEAASVVSSLVTLLGGWSWVEENGVWSVDRQAECAVLVSDSTEVGGEVRVTLHAFPGRQSAITVRANGVAGVLAESSGDRRVYSLPCSGADATGLMRIRFEVDELFAPSDCLGSSDRRRLGVFFESAEYRVPAEVDSVRRRGLRRRRT